MDKICKLAVYGQYSCNKHRSNIYNYTLFYTGQTEEIHK